MSKQRAIFISYRREDSADVTGRIYDRLITAFGRDATFKDVDSIPFGSDFREHLHDAVSQCQVFLAIIGKDWTRIKDDNGLRRLDNPTDFVRIEIEAALKRNIPVIPLLVGNSNMPSKSELPRSLSQMFFRQGTQIRRDPDFHKDMDRLVEGIRKMLDQPFYLQDESLTRTEQIIYPTKIVEDRIIPEFLKLSKPQNTNAKFAPKHSKAFPDRPLKVNYSKLINALSEGNWQEADHETNILMLQMGMTGNTELITKGDQKWLTSDSIQGIPCTLLIKIDNLWRQFSQNRFGFSAQKYIWKDIIDYSNVAVQIRIYEFGNRVGWFNKTKNIWIDYNKFTFDVTAPKGHLPSLGYGLRNEANWRQAWSSYCIKLLKHISVCIK